MYAEKSFDFVSFDYKIYQILYPRVRNSMIWHYCRWNLIYLNLPFLGGDRFGRGILYGILMIWLFIGVAIVSDKFMESIETITGNYFLTLFFCQKVPEIDIFLCVFFSSRERSYHQGSPHRQKPSRRGQSLEWNCCQLDFDGFGFMGWGIWGN